MSIILNKGQAEAVNAAINWYRHSSEQVFQIAGPAGTGKSVVIAEIIRRLGLRENQILPMAYTGQACSVMRTRGFANARTIYSGLYKLEFRLKRDERGVIVRNPIFNTPIKERYFKPKDPRELDQNIKLIVIDEAFMVPGDMRHVINNTGIKILAAGDPNQLPPVTGNPGFLVTGNVMYLNELVRQSEESPIIYLATRARNGLPIEPGMYGRDVLALYESDLNDSIIASCPVILADTNVARDHYNDIMRHRILGIHSDVPLFGERVVCRKNDWDVLNFENLPLTNGLAGTVIEPPGAGTRDANNTVPLTFLADASPYPFKDIRINQKYLNSDAVTRHRMHEDRYIRGQLFEYAYAITVHCSQGSEYDCGMYVEGKYNQDVKAARYTAITRFKHQMIYAIHKPKFWSYYNDGGIDFHGTY